LRSGADTGRTYSLNKQALRKLVTLKLFECSEVRADTQLAITSRLETQDVRGGIYQAGRHSEKGTTRQRTKTISEECWDWR
jgi:hypothetical protein